MGDGQGRSMERTRGWAIRISRTFVHADGRRVCLRARGRRCESSLYDFVRVVPEFGACTWLSAKTLAAGVAGDCEIFSVRSSNNIQSC